MKGPTRSVLHCLSASVNVCVLVCVFCGDKNLPCSFYFGFDSLFFLFFEPAELCSFFITGTGEL